MEYNFVSVWAGLIHIPPYNCEFLRNWSKPQNETLCRICMEQIYLKEILTTFGQLHWQQMLLCQVELKHSRKREHTSRILWAKGANNNNFSIKSKSVQTKN